MWGTGLGIAADGAAALIEVSLLALPAGQNPRIDFVLCFRNRECRGVNESGEGILRPRAQSLPRGSRHDEETRHAGREFFANGRFPSLDGASLMPFRNAA